MRLLLPLLLLAVGLACSPGGTADENDGIDTSFPDDTDAVPDTDDAPEPVWVTWGLGGTLAVSGGMPDSGASALTLEQRPDGADPAAACALAATWTGAAPVAPLPEDPPLVAWWSLTVAPDAGGACAWTGPEVVQLALGAPDTDVAAAAERAGLSWTTSLALYAGDGATLSLIGVAGTDGMLDGSAPAGEGAPADGLYRLHTLYGMPLLSR